MSHVKVHDDIKHWILYIIIAVVVAYVGKLSHDVLISKPVDSYLLLMIPFSVFSSFLIYHSWKGNFK